MGYCLQIGERKGLEYLCGMGIKSIQKCPAKFSHSSRFPHCFTLGSRHPPCIADELSAHVSVTRSNMKHHSTESVELP